MGSMEWSLDTFLETWRGRKCDTIRVFVILCQTQPYNGRLIRLVNDAGTGYLALTILSSKQLQRSAKTLRRFIEDIDTWAKASRKKFKMSDTSALSI